MKTNKLHWLWFPLLLTASVATFYGSLHNPFVLDDSAKIQDNPDLRIPNPSVANFIHPYAASHSHLENDPSRPLTYFLYWLCWQRGEGSTVPFHLLNWVLHTISALLFCRILTRLKFSELEAIWGGLAFLLMPINVGTALYSYGLSDVLSATLVLGALWLGQLPKTAYQTVAMIILFVLALLAKQSAIVFPLLLLFVAKPTRRQFYLTATVGIAYLGLRYWYFGELGDLEAYDHFPTEAYAVSQGIMIWKYVQLALLPLGLCLDHAQSLTMHPKYWQLLGWLLIVVVTVFAVRALLNEGAKSQSSPHWPGAWLFFLLPLAPTSSFFPTTDLLVERRAYLATGGLVWLTLLITRALPHVVPKKAVVTVMMGALVGYFYLSRQRVALFGSEISIYQEVLAQYPRDLRARENLAAAHLKVGHWAEGQRAFEGILQEYPDSFLALTNLAVIYSLPNTGVTDFSRSAELSRAAIKVRPDDLRTQLNLAFALLALNQWHDAETHFRKSMELNSNSSLAHYGLGLAHKALGHFVEARIELQRAVLLEPERQDFKKALEGLP